MNENKLALWFYFDANNRLPNVELIAQIMTFHGKKSSILS